MQSFIVAYYLSPLVYLISHWCLLFAAGITAVGGITVVGERAREFVLGLRAPLLQSLIVAHYLPPFASTYTLGFGMASD